MQQRSLRSSSLDSSLALGLCVRLSPVRLLRSIWRSLQCGVSRVGARWRGPAESQARFRTRKHVVKQVRRPPARPSHSCAFSVASLRLSKSKLAAYKTEGARRQPASMRAPGLASAARQSQCGTALRNPNLLCIACRSLFRACVGSSALMSTPIVAGRAPRSCKSKGQACSGRLRTCL